MPRLLETAEDTINCRLLVQLLRDSGSDPVRILSPAIHIRRFGLVGSPERANLRPSPPCRRDDPDPRAAQEASFELVISP